MVTNTSQLYYDLNIISNWIYGENGFKCNIDSLSVSTAKVCVYNTVECELKTDCAPCLTTEAVIMESSQHCNTLTIDTGPLNDKILNRTSLLYWKDTVRNYVNYSESLNCPYIQE
jgi:hypothetical protein